MGARGIGNQIEERLVKPLANELFGIADATRAEPLAVTVHTVHCETPPYRLALMEDGR